MVESGAWDTQLRSLYTTVTCKVFLGNCLCNLSETAQGVRDCPWGKGEALGMGSWLYVGFKDMEGSSCWQGKWIPFCLEIHLLTAHSLKRQYAPLAWGLQDSDLWFKQKMSIALQSLSHSLHAEGKGDYWKRKENKRQLGRQRKMRRISNMGDHGHFIWFFAQTPFWEKKKKCV